MMQRLPLEVFAYSYACHGFVISACSQLMVALHMLGSARAHMVARPLPNIDESGSERRFHMSVDCDLPDARIIWLFRYTTISMTNRKKSSSVRKILLA